MPPPNNLPSPRWRRGLGLLLGSLLVLGALCVAGRPAQARCVSTGAVYSCLTPGGPPIMMTCYGAGGARTCMDFAGKYIIVGQHWRMQLVDDTSATDSSMVLTPTEDVSFEQQLETALAANAAANLPKAPASTSPTAKKPPPAR